MPTKEILMQMYLVQLEEKDVMGIYGASKNILPARMCYLHPTAAESFLKMNKEKTVRCSDMFRTVESSLEASQRDRNALPPGRSGHNFGFSIDIDVMWMQKTHKFKTKKDLDLWMESGGWYCHNPAGSTRSIESWHYNYFGDEAEKYLALRKNNLVSTYKNCLEGKIVDYYGQWWAKEDVATTQTALKKLGLYNGAIDGKTGPLTKEAVKAFQRAWLLDVDGAVGPMTRRTLMTVSANKIIVAKKC